MTTFDGAMARFAVLSDADMERPWSWRDREDFVRAALYRSLEAEQMALVDATGLETTEAARILDLAQRAFGDLRGLLVGRDDDLLDQTPGPGQWSLRTTLGHVLVVEERYRVRTHRDALRPDGAPLWDGVGLPPLDPPPYVAASPYP